MIVGAPGAGNVAAAAKKPAPRRKKGEASVKRARSAYNFFVAE